MLEVGQVTIRSPEDGELKAFLETTETAFGEALHEGDVERWTPLLRLERQLWAWDGDVAVATAGTYEFRLQIPGGDLPTAGVTMVGVHPSHRRRGILTEMMRRQLDDAYERGEPLAALWASEAPIYGRFGYGVATAAARIEADRDRIAFRAPDEPTGRTRLVSLDDARSIVPAVYERVRRATPGMIDRSEDWWRSLRLVDPEHWRNGGGPLFCVVLELDGEPEGYAMYRLRGSWEDGVPGAKLDVREALGASPAATREIWRFLFGVDLTRQVRAWLLPPDHPLFLSVTEPRRLQMRVGDGLWLRLLDVHAALAGRSYGCDGRVVVEVGDRFCTWNDGVWRLEVEGSEPAVERGGGQAELRLDIGDLASAYLGGFSFAALQRAGRVEELADGAVERADALFRTTVTPWCAEIF
ncbi:MAG: GNAT family N-acetyltransferase [Thermoleophilia bacterium]|nr:GNAT family N-acetyltransferase [Thermoleophilia bacterium]